MRVKVRFTSGNAPVVLTLSNTDPVSSLLTQIKEKGNLSGEIEIIHSYPHKTLNLSSVPPNLPLDALPFKLDGEQLTARSLEPDTSTSSTSSSAPAAPKPLPPKPKPRSSPAIFAPPPPNDDDPPDVLLPERGTVVLRVMEDDNSCLFRAISYVVTNGLTSPTELRQIVTSGIQADPVTYNEAVLGQKVDDYCSWISMESSWGGGIELAILAKFFDVEIVAIDVSTLSTMRFNDPQPRFCIVVYSGIHYDALALSPLTAFSFSSPSPDQDIRTFEAGDAGVLAAARELVQKLKGRKYFTDTKKFTLKCGVCGEGVVGEEDARRHARRTGHGEFGEY